MIEVAQGIQYIHSEGMVYGNLSGVGLFGSFYIVHQLTC